MSNLALRISCNQVNGLSLSRLLVCGVWALCLAVATETPVLGAEGGDDSEEEDPLAESERVAEEEVVVTGSRLKRDTYTSVAPMQVITADVSREAGLVDAAEIVQNATVSSGEQVDLTYSGYVLDDGPGSQTADLRGLGSSRTLLLVNGRRMGPAGVEGAPTSPDLGLIPGLLVQQYDLLLDGASSVYGSDAVAGVLNVILRKDFDGLEIDVYPRRFYHGSGDQNLLSIAWGRNFDRGVIGLGTEYYSTESVKYADRPWTAGCRKHVEIDENGRIRNEDLYFPTVLGMDLGECALGRVGGKILIPGNDAGFIYFTPNWSNGGWPNFSKATHPYPYLGDTFGIDGNGDGRTDVNLADYNLSGRQDYVELYGPWETLNVMLFGEYTFAGSANLTPFFELGYVVDDWSHRGREFELFPRVPARNPFNVCNPEGEGVDCGLAFDALLTNPHYVRQYADFYTRWNDCGGVAYEDCAPARFDLLYGPLGPWETIPVLTVSGDRNRVSRYLEQFRYVAGLRGDLPMLDFAGLLDWSFEFAYVHTRSDGHSHRLGIRGDRLNLALGRYSMDNVPCENDTGTPLADDAQPGCVPVNLFAPSLYDPLVGDFATQAEREYLFDDRGFATEYRQTVVTYYMTGRLFGLPAGAVDAGFGVEFREDEITSTPGDVARDGLFFGFFSDGGASGEKYTQEAFGEIEIPILADRPGATELTVNVSGRFTDDQISGSASTGSLKVAYRPINSLLLRATRGTSFRAPNLREIFLRAQSSFRQVYDPCLLPEGAIDLFTNEYDPAADGRESRVIENCRANGVEPTVVHNNGFNSYSVESFAGGSSSLEDETSTSLTVGFAWEQPFTGAFDFTVGVNYYEIEVDNTIIEPSAQFVVNDCYYSKTGNSPFCSRISRGGRGPLIDYLDLSFINRDNETVRGVDFNLTFDRDFTVFDRPFQLGVDVNAHRLIERSTLFTNEEGVADFNEFQREWYFPEYRATANARLDYDRWRLSWTARYLAKGLEWLGAVDELGDIYASTGWGSSTCLGPPNDVLCRDYADAPSYLLHSGSVWYSGDTWYGGVGVYNIFDKAPPQIQEYATTIKNTPIGAGYDLLGRAWFFSLRIRLFERG